MGRAKDIVVKFISSKDAIKVIKKYHYSGKVVNNSQLHFGVFIDGVIGGAMQFGPPMVKKPQLKLVKDTPWNGMLELNRMAFGPILPRNSESRAISIAMKLIKKNYPHIKWVLSFSDACLCGDGVIYRASGFVLTQIKKNSTLIKLENGTISTNMTMAKGKHILKTKGGAKKPKGSKPLVGFQMRYIYFIDKTVEKKLTVEKIPFSKIDELGIGMYKGDPIKRR